MSFKGCPFKFSMNSCRDISKLFAKMFNCPVADAFKLGPTKCPYLICYGLASYFSQLLVKELNSSLLIATSFDECFNRINQKGKWTYLLDARIIHPIKCQLDQSCSKIREQNIIQVSSDEPNVNLKFLDLVNEIRANDELPSSISIGTCSLHTLHRPFQHSTQIWSVGKVLRAMWKILDQSPSRRADYEKVTNSTTYLLQFCSHRWVENENVAIRAESI